MSVVAATTWSAAVAEELLVAASLAPSADNNQPWRLRVGAQSCAIYLDKERLLTSDVNYLFDLTSIGAVAENMYLTAQALGVPGELRWNADGIHDSGDPLAELRTLEHSEEHPDAADCQKLHKAIPQRHTNRKRYSRRPIAEACRRVLNEHLNSFPQVRLDWINDRPTIRQVSSLVATADSLRFSHRSFLQELARQVRFTSGEVEATRDGLDVRTLELPPGGVSILRMFNFSWFAQVCKASRLNHLMSWPSAWAVRDSGALAVFSLPSESGPVDYMEGGRAIQRFWLACQSLGLAVQPLGSLSIFMLQKGKQLGSEAEALSSEWKRRLPQVGPRMTQLVMRVGYCARQPSVRALRRAPQDLLRGA